MLFFTIVGKYQESKVFLAPFSLKHRGFLNRVNRLTVLSFPFGVAIKQSLPTFQVWFILFTLLPDIHIMFRF